MIDAGPTPDPTATESREERRRRLCRERVKRWRAAHPDADAESVTRNARNAVEGEMRAARNELHRMGFDPDEVVRVNELERQVGALRGWVSDISAAQRKTEQRLNGPAAPAWGIGDRVLVPAPITQARNRQNLSTVLTVLAFGEVASMNAVRREATVRISPDQAVSVRYEDVMAVRAKPKPPVTGKR